jgi:hypothetical protein
MKYASKVGKNPQKPSKTYVKEIKWHKKRSYFLS